VVVTYRHAPCPPAAAGAGVTATEVTGAVEKVPAEAAVVAVELSPEPPHPFDSVAITTKLTSVLARYVLLMSL
jgi:hypothetical protein